jgi:hypothetical protein
LTSEPCRNARVVASYETAYSTPVVVAHGDPLVPLKTEAKSPGWVWCSGPSGWERWVPARILVHANGAWTSSEDYDARELTVTVGELLDVVSIESGWAWCTTPCGGYGWVPLDHLQLLPATACDDSSEHADNS